MIERSFSAKNAPASQSYRPERPRGEDIRLLREPAPNTPKIEDRWVGVQSALGGRGQHRAPSIPDLLIAATAELAELTVLRLDNDFELIAEITGQPVERLDPA